MSKPRFEAIEEMFGWGIWDEKRKLYVADFGGDEEACRDAVARRNEKVAAGKWRDLECARCGKFIEEMELKTQYGNLFTQQRFCSEKCMKGRNSK